jgi:hypothetical protein
VIAYERLGPKRCAPCARRAPRARAPKAGLLRGREIGLAALRQRGRGATVLAHEPLEERTKGVVLRRSAQ